MEWTVGDLAAATGLSARVLRHWDEIGLVRPERTASGHRTYGPEDVVRLHHAVALRRAGLGLHDIAALLSGDRPPPLDVLRGHLARLDAEIAERTRLRDRLAEVLAGAGTDPDTQLTKVISAMTMFDGYVHGYHQKENLRLHDQAGALVAQLHANGYPPGARVLELGCGVGAQTATLAALSPGAHIVAVDRSSTALAAAKQRVRELGHDDVTFVQADVYDLPLDGGELAAGSFDEVFVCFVLEHLVRPVDALVRLRSMLKPGGRITVVEGDHGSALFHPDSAAAREVIDCQVALQRQAGGDALIGRRLYPLLREAGFTSVDVEPRPVYADGGDAERAERVVRRTFTAMVEGIREPAIAAGLTTPERFAEGVRDLLRTAESDGVFTYTFFRATASS
jgi:ubiquinone/menaquinone biosynthesis C-methylase UbiE